MAAYTYDPNGNRASLQANGVVTNYTYNAANMITSLTNKRGSTVLSGYEYTYNLDGYQNAKTDHTGKSTTYRYDLLGRLIGESENGSTYTYQYDDRSNCSTLTVVSPKPYTVHYTYDLNNRLLESTKTSPGTGGNTAETSVYRYDANGNQLSRQTQQLTPKGLVPESIGFKEEVAAIELMEYNNLARYPNHRFGTGAQEH